MDNYQKTIRSGHRTSNTRHQAAFGWRAMVAVWLICHLFYTPIHLLIEAHDEDVRSEAPVSTNTAVACLDHDDSHHDDHHGWHPSSQHSFEAVNFNRLVVMSTLIVVAVPWLEAVEEFSDFEPPPECRRPGLAPPELTRGWQFHTRAAPPVRAPSVLS